MTPSPLDSPALSLLAVVAHPDDEALLVAGILAQHAAAGARTAVVTATWTANTHRIPELTDALHILGADASSTHPWTRPFRQTPCTPPPGKRPLRPGRDGGRTGTT